VCAGCLAQPPAFGHAVAAADYAFPWDRLIGRFKFQQAPELASALAEPLARAVGRRLGEADWPRPGLVLPVPLAPRRAAERGYNQAWELARQVARRLALPASATVLSRWRETPHQVGASRAERLRNLADAFMVEPQLARAVAGRELALVDDVLTTGSTAAAAVAALRAGGARRIEVWVAAQVPASSQLARAK